MLQGVSRVFGSNTAAAFAACHGKTFVAADNGIVIIENGKGQQWLPGAMNKYCIGHVAVSSTGVVCVSERRMQVSLSFFDVTTLESIGTVETDIRVDVAAMAFSDSGKELYVLSTIPSACVLVLQSSSGKGGYSVVSKTVLPRKETPQSFFPSGSEAEGSVRFVVRYKDQICGYARTSGRTECERSFILKAAADSAASFGGSALCFVSAESATVCTYTFGDERQRDVCALPPRTQASALIVKDSTAYIATLIGDLFVVNLNDGSNFRASLPPRASPVCRMEVVGGGETLLMGSAAGLFNVDLSALREGNVVFQLMKGWSNSTTLKCLSTDDKTEAVWVLRDGTICVYGNEGVTLHSAGVVTETAAIDACLLRSAEVAVLYSDATLRCFEIRRGSELWRHKCSESLPKIIEADGHGNAVCCGVDTIRFLYSGDSSVIDHGIVQAPLLAPISVARWVPNEMAVLTVCENGDAFLVSAPAEGCVDSAHAAESLMRNTWRLDFPIADVLICRSTSDTLTLYVHSLDHDSKVYTLDRKYEGETRVSRPLFIINDHQSGGGCLARMNDSTLLSCGKDGNVVARDLTCYQTHLAPTPPTREKRKPLWVCNVRSSFRGGITTAATFKEGTQLLCAGHDAVLHCVSLVPKASQTSWDEPQWAAGGAASAHANQKASGTSVPTGDVRGRERDSLRADLDRVRESWAKVMSGKDDGVPLEALLTPDQRAAFDAECDEAIHAMQEHNYYHTLLNEYTQDTIRQRCCASMLVPRMKVVSLNVKGVEVHNFHIHHTARTDALLARKALFLRRLQAKAAGGRRNSLMLRSRAPNEAAVDEGTRSAADYRAAMLNETDVYTQSRMVLQSLLVKGSTFALKEDYNSRFQDLQEIKKQAVAQIEERTQRCIVISKQLGELPAALYVGLTDPEENPDSLFHVHDSELSAEAQGLIAPSESVAIVSPVDEAALHLWMDGLEKEVERLEVNVPVPDFADEASDAFVPPDERTEEQLRGLEAYTKRLKEETERVNSRKDALRSEFAALQQKARETAIKVDEQLNSVRDYRLNIIEEVDEGELRLALLLQHRLRTRAAHQRYRLCEAKSETLRDELLGAQAALTQRRRGFGRAQERHSDIEDQMSSYATEACMTYPFDDGVAGEKLQRRFARWQRRFADGKAPLPKVDAPAPECSLEQWGAFCEHCDEVARMQALLHEAAADVQQAAEGVAEAQLRCEFVEERLDAMKQTMADVRDKSVADSLDTHVLCRLHQGQIQDEAATTCTEFANSNVRWRKDVVQYNDLILASAGEGRGVLEKIFQRRKLMQFLEWEQERLQYNAGTLQMELRQLHTLRVTRQMQEWLSGDVIVSEEKTLASIQRHMQLVDANMSRKVDDLRAVVRQLKGQIAERTTENVIVGGQCGDLSDTLRDSAAVHHLIGARADGSNAYGQRAREIFATSELEELARSQQEELVRLKHEVDRLRERTFPSFAVVAKQTR